MARISSKKKPAPRVSEATAKTLVQDSLKRYLADVRRYPILSKEEEFDIARRLQATQDPELTMALITANLRLVVKIAFEYQSSTIPLLDLIQEGNVGLMQAVKKFDVERNIRLSSYAQWWIRAYILKYLMDNYKLVKLGTTQAQRRLFYNLKKEREKLLNQGITPSAELLAKRLDVKEKDVVEMQMRLNNRELSLDAPVRDDDDSSTLSDLIAAQLNPIDDTLSRRQLAGVLLGKLDDFRSDLEGRDEVIWDRRLVAEDPLTLQQLGDIFGVSRERARQLQARIISRLSKFLERELKDYGDVQLDFPMFH